MKKQLWNALMVLSCSVAVSICAFVSFGCKTEESDPEPTYTVTYDGNGAVGGVVPVDTNAYVEGQGVQVSGNTGNLTLAGYVFSTWNTVADGSGSVYKTGDTFQMKNANITLYAQWVAAGDTAYTVAYYQQDLTGETYTLVETDTKKLYGTTKAATEAVTNEYAGFTVKPFEQQTIAADGTTVVKIYYDRNIISLTFDCGVGTWSDGGSTVVKVSGKYGAAVSGVPTDMKKTGYSFSQWNADIPTTYPESDKTFTATYVRDGDYAITYQLNGGVNASANPAGYNVDSEAITFVAAARTGYTFAGWYSDEQCTTKITGVAKGTTGAVSVYAKWTMVTYAITYKLNDGTNAESNPSSFTVESDEIIFEPATREGYVFAGWYRDQSFTKRTVCVSHGSSESVTVYAKWTPVTYRIVYELDSGTNDAANPATYTIETNAITFADATRAGCKFVGWYSDASFTTKTTGIAKGTMGTVTVYAKWLVITNGISVSVPTYTDLDFGLVVDVSDADEDGVFDFDSDSIKVSVTNREALAQCVNIGWIINGKTVQFSRSSFVAPSSVLLLEDGDHAFDLLTYGTNNITVIGTTSAGTYSSGTVYVTLAAKAKDGE